MIEAIAISLGLPLLLVTSVIEVESGGRNVINFHDGHSPSYGLGQMKMRTARSLDPYFAASDLLLPERNVRLTALYLKQLHGKYRTWEEVLCFYNSGKPRKSCRYASKVRKVWAMKKLEAMNEQI